MVQSDLLIWTVKALKRKRKSFGTVFKQKNTCGRAEYLETLQAAIIFHGSLCILRKWLIFQKAFFRPIQKFAFFV